MVVNHETVAGAWMDDQGRLLPNRLPRDWKNLSEFEPDMPKVNRERARLWNRLADLWAENPDFRRVVLRTSAPWLISEKAALRFWPEVVEPLWQDARRRRQDPNWLRRLTMFTAKARTTTELENATLELPIVRGRAATGSGIALASSAKPIDPEFHSRAEIVTLYDEQPVVLKLGELKAAYDEATTKYRQTKGVNAAHRRLPLGPTAHLVLLISVRGGIKSSQARVLGTNVTPVEITIPPLQTASGAGVPIVACWSYSDGSLLLRYRDQNREEKNTAWSAKRKKWFPASPERPLTELLKDIGLDMPHGTATALEPEKLWSKARKLLGSKIEVNDDDEFEDGTSEPDEE